MKLTVFIPAATSQENGSLYRTSASSSKEASLVNTGSKTSIALTTLGLGLC
ncbi:MAG: hypothetical protein ACLRG1_02800 [Streptococcus salivarius]